MLSFRSIASATVLALAACAAPVSEPGASAESTAVAAHDPDYLVFGSHAEAVAWFQTPSPITGSLLGSVTAIVPEEDPRIAPLRAMIAAHWGPIVQRFAPQIPAPRVLLVESTFSNAAILFDNRVKKTADLMLVTTKILERSPEDIDALLAHELGHLVLKNGDPVRADALLKYYSVTPGVEPLGLTQPDDPAVRGVLAPWRAAVANIGFSLKELNGYPAGTGVSTMFLGRYFGAHFDPALEACTALNTQLRALVDSLRQMRTDGVGLSGPPELRVKLDAATRAFEDAAAPCLRPPPGQSLFQAMGETFGVPPEGLEAAASAEELAIVRAAPDAPSALFAVVRHARESMRAAEAAHDFYAFRMYTGEEQADDFAMTVLALEGKDPVMMGRSVNHPDALRASCEASVEAGQIPDYGGLVDAHHSACFRLYHARAFATHLAAGGEGIPGVALSQRARGPEARFDPRAIIETD